MTIKINGKEVGRGTRPYILAEIGINHGGDIDVAVEMIKAASMAGADGVKFQTFKVEHLTQVKEQHDLFKPVEFGPMSWELIADRCTELGIDFISTPFGIEEANMLRLLSVPAIKISSGDLTYVQLLDHVAGFRIPVIMSTGMAEIPEIRTAYKRLQYGGCNDVVLLHCVSCYPTEPREAALGAISNMMRNFSETPIGYSDHTVGTWACIAAMAMGACFIEKHFTLDHDLPGPDHALAADGKELQEIVIAANNIHSSGLSGYKRCQDCEIEGRTEMRRGIHAARDIAQGERFTTENVKIVRPADGLYPNALEDILKGAAQKHLLEGAPIQPYDVKESE